MTQQVEMDAMDRRLLNRIQSDFPIAKRPYQAIAEEMEIAEQEVIERLQRLRESGAIRRIGANFFPEKLGFVSTLCAARVPEEKVEVFAETVNRHSGVTHNYLRDSDFNMWFTFIAPSRETIACSLEEIAKETGVPQILNLPATRVFKIRAHFNL
jgi:DNA-binding Lrp family transcriptional regulator